MAQGSDVADGGAAALAIAKQGYLYVGGDYHTNAKGEQFMAGQAYVEYQIPEKKTHPYPIVMIPGGNQSGACFTGTPDGRDGWAQYFLRQGYAVYVMEQPGRGRSAHHPEIQGDLRTGSAQRVKDRYTKPGEAMLFPPADRHSQWPGAGVPGDPAFDAFLASQLTNLADRFVLQRHNQDAGAALLDEIGPAILMTHSQSGTIGWLIADARPDLVKCIVAIEPGCAVGFIEPIGPPDFFEYSGIDRHWGLASIPLTYDPPASDASELSFVQQTEPDGPELARCWFQAEPARKLINLAKVPVVIFTAEASFHTAHDHGTAAFLRQAGVTCTHIRLDEQGFRGNGHMMMLEKNSDKIADLIARWLDDNIAATTAR
jgi:pimeloyl-ACP methyl ester carboxylesterase